MPEKTPQDRKAKADNRFHFTHNGKKYALPHVSDAAALVDGGITMDAILAPDDEMAQLRLGLAMLNVVEVPAESLAALRAMTSTDMLETLGEWMSHKPAGEASVGESLGSSD